MPNERFYDPYVAKMGVPARPTRTPLAAGTTRGQREFNAKVHKRFRLKSRDGFYLHMSGAGLTDKASDAWIGFRHQLIALRLRNPAARRMRVIVVPPPTPASVVWKTAFSSSARAS